MAWLYSDQWAAGFFDGEGNVYLRRRPKRRTREVRVQVTQKLRSPLEQLRDRWGGSLTPTKTPSGCYRWRTGGQKAEAFLRAIDPHVLVKRSAVDEALAERASTRKWARR
jgi:hypothetical protein